MSSQQQPKPARSLPDEAAVVEYLRTYPEFFDDNRQLLTSLRLPHASGGGTVSLVERQVASLRQKNVALDRRIKEFISVARDNDRLAGRIHNLALDLIGARALDDALEAIETHLRTAFSADESLMVLYKELDGFATVPKQRFVRLTARSDDALKPFETFLAAGRPRCGQVRDSQRDFLFGKDTDEIGSAALVPLGDQASLGFLAIGSVSAEHFHPTMSMDFLLRLGEMVSRTLERCRQT